VKKVLFSFHDIKTKPKNASLRNPVERSFRLSSQVNKRASKERNLHENQ